MLAAGQDLIAEQGMTVSLEHLSLEEIIRRAGVSRSSVYRRWPYRDDYFADLLLAIAQTPLVFPESEDTIAMLTRTIEDRRADFATAEGRRRIVVEGLRLADQANLEAMVASPQWRTYIALTATFQSLPDGELRERVGAALAAREQASLDHSASVLGALLRLIGYRVAGPLPGDDGLRAIATALNATLTGFVAQAAARPELVTEATRIAAFGGDVASWTLPGYARAALFLAMTEPDPAVVWDDERLSAMDALLRERIAEARRLRREGLGARDGSTGADSEAKPSDNAATSPAAP